MESTKLALKVAEQEPLAKIVEAREFPPGITDEEIEGWGRMTIIVSQTLHKYAYSQVRQTGSHPVGTAAMASRKMGGVVDSSLKVYGTSNIRVVDASILPMSIAAHTQATVYAIGEKVSRFVRLGVWFAY